MTGTGDDRAHAGGVHRDGSGDAASARAVTDLTYQEASDELDAIIAELDAGTIDVDRLGARYQRAAEIAEELDRRIRANRARIDELAPRLERLGGDADG